jgi:hypothetical protein
MCLTLRSDVEPKIARVSSSYVQSSGYVLLRSSFTLVPSRLLPGGVMEWGLRFFPMKSRPLPIPIMKRAPDVMDRDALKPCQPREHTFSGVDATRTQWQPQRHHTRRKVQRNACSCFSLSLPSWRRRDVLVCPRVNSERSAAGPLALPAPPRWGQ